MAKTSPYFPDGSTSDLQEAVRVMGRYHSGEPLSQDDCAALAVFLETLTGEDQGKPL